MSQERSILDRRSTRLSMSIPVNISGIDADGQTFSEGVRSVIINKHGGKIATTRQLAMGAEVFIENHAVGLTAKASIVWLAEERTATGLLHVGLQLLEAQNIWGIAFPPDDWVAEHGEEVRLKLRPAGSPGSASITANGSNPSSSAAEEAALRALQELQDSAKICLQDFQNRLKQLAQRVNVELDSGLRFRASEGKDRELGALEEHIRMLRKNMDAALDEIGKLEAQVGSVRSAALTKR